VSADFAGPLAAAARPWLLVPSKCQMDFCNHMPYPQPCLLAYRNRGRGQYGCSHYRRRVKFITPCCDEEWWCRHCHNKAKDTEEQVCAAAAVAASGDPHVPGQA
jgi:hypothetical protein